MAAGDDRGHGGNTGYDDQVDAYYSWDDKVPNHRSISVGDVVALWDKKRLLGVSVVEEVETSCGFKTQLRCVHCSATRIQPRKTITPKYRCSKCGSTFEHPRVESVPVRLYVERHDAAWTPLEGLLDADELRSLNAHSGDINAMRPMDWHAFSAALRGKGAVRAVERVSSRAPDLVWDAPHGIELEVPQGFTRAVVRVRRGQSKFREKLLASQGSQCAFTGAAPARVLEAGHLYSYARLGAHHEHGGFMLRRDIHRLFDDGLLAVDPSSLRVDVAKDLARYPQYARLHGGPLELRLHEEQVGWLAKHWDEHRASL